jgi:MoxR-like ATPase
MGLAEITSRDAVLHAIREYDDLGRDAFLAKYNFQKARKFVVVHDGREYDSKPLLAAAHRFQFPEAGPLVAGTFKGGNPTISRLRSLGFAVSRHSASTSDVRFSTGDCRLFEKYPRRVHWSDANVSAEDKAAFRDIWQRLKLLAAWLADNARIDVPLQDFTSAYQANGYSQPDVWCCVFPAEVPNKSYGLQVAFIISASGAELCICLGPGQSQLRDPGSTAAARQALEQLRVRLSSVPAPVSGVITRGLPADAAFRTSWRQPAGGAEFQSASEWLRYAARPNGRTASISRYLTAGQLDRLGTGIGDEMLRLADAAAPLFEYCYAEQLPEPEPERRPAGEILPDATFDADSLSALAAARPDPLEIDRQVYRAIAAAIRSEKHIILTGPPGTAKTTLAEVAGQLARRAGLCAGHTLTTATADWTTYETIGGLRPTGSGTALEFRDGLFLETIRQNRWLLVDELNRSNFDRAFGQFFTVLSKQPVVLPYEDPASGHRIVLVPEEAEGRYDPGEYSLIRIPRSWRIIATMNVFDKSLLFEMSFALMRRFAFIEVPSPARPVFTQLWQRKLKDLPAGESERISRVLRDLLELTEIKDLGPAVFIDMAGFSREYLRQNAAATDGELTFQLFYSYLLPQFEGITAAEGKELYRRLSSIVGGGNRQRLKTTLADVLGLDLQDRPTPADQETEDELYSAAPGPSAT